jgi:DNA-binding FrmR family transcriptional regulator
VNGQSPPRASDFRHSRLAPLLGIVPGSYVAALQLVARFIERTSQRYRSDDDCADVLMRLANVRGGTNSLMAEVPEDHIRLHMLTNEKNAMPSVELAEDLIGLVRAYLK